MIIIMIIMIIIIIIIIIIITPTYLWKTLLQKVSLTNWRLVKVLHHFLSGIMLHYFFLQ